MCIGRLPEQERGRYVEPAQLLQFDSAQRRAQPQRAVEPQFAVRTDAAVVDVQLERGAQLRRLRRGLLEPAALSRRFPVAHQRIPYARYPHLRGGSHPPPDAYQMDHLEGYFTLQSHPGDTFIPTILHSFFFFFFLSIIIITKALKLSINN